MAIKAIDVRSGQGVKWRDAVWIVQDNQKVAKGKGRSYQSIRLKNLKTGQVVEDRFRTEDAFEQAIIQRKAAQYLYSDTNGHTFMDMETFEELRVPDELIGGHRVYLTPSLEVAIGWMEGNPVTADLPFTVVLEVEDTPPQLKGATATNQLKDAVCKGGARVRVPPFVEKGERIKVDTRTGEYMERA
ncbi:MAG: elongation factor P [Planctomycetota bacterium]|nr:elongation factor P [Planctomycetota bacterium]